MDYPVVEHGSSRPGRWLRARRLKLALGIAVVEAALVVVDWMPLLVAVLVVAVALAFHLLVGRRLRLHAAREASAVAALSQLFVAVVPVLVFVVGAIALIALVLVALVAVLALVARRR